jgi:hypothetical protein
MTPSTFTPAPGEKFTILVDAFDPDGRSDTLVGTVVDKKGAQVQMNLVLTVAEQLTYTLAEASGDYQITQDTQNPALFHVTAPG